MRHPDPFDVPGRLALRVLPSTDRAGAGRAWTALEAADDADLPVFAGWAWTSTWLEHYGDAVEHQFLVAERDGQVCGVALLTRSTLRYGPLPVRRLHLGTAGAPRGVFVEYNGLAARRPDRDAFARAVLEHAGRLPAWDELRLDGFDPAHAAAMVTAAPGFVLDPRASRVLDLNPGVDDPGVDGLVDTLGSRSTRSMVRRSLRGVSPFTTEWAADTDRALSILDDLERLHQARWVARGEAGSFASERFRSFHRAIIRRWMPEGRVAVFAVHSGGQVVGAVYGWVVGDTLQNYQGGFAAVESNKVRVGHATHVLFATEARARGLRHYEHLAGDSRYKTELSNDERHLVWATLVRRRPRAIAVDRLRELGRAVRRRRANRAERAQPAATGAGATAIS